MASPAPRDLLVASRLSHDQAASILAPFGFRDLRRAHQSLLAMAEVGPARAVLAEIVGELLRCVSLSADPDQALALLERLAASAPSGPPELFAYLRKTPRTLALLARVLGASPFMGEILVRDPAYLYWVADPAALGRPRLRPTLRRELAAALLPCRSEEQRLDALRVFKRREILRIGVRDILRLSTVEETLGSLSLLAEVLIAAALGISEGALRAEHPWRAPPRARPGAGFAVIGLGKLGGGELNFSSDVDLLYVYASDRGRAPGTTLARPDYYERLSRRVTAALGKSTGEGQVFRVDLRLRPEGRLGSLAHSMAGLRSYYAERGRPWERLMLLKAWPVAGDRRLGARFLETVRPFIHGTPFGPEAAASVWRLNAQIAARTRLRGEERTNVKLGIGGIREIELVAQALQARFGGRRTALRRRGTLDALVALRQAGRLPAEEADVLAGAYLFLRDVENKLQMASDAQVHVLPADPGALRALARTLGYGEAARQDAVRDFLADHARHTGTVHALFTHLLQDRMEGQPAWPASPGRAPVLPKRRS